uniref:Putative SNARE family protein n=1 Tax=Davidia involucrata TaxID=16924 RepID=A0A5B7C889_DAVIN
MKITALLVLKCNPEARIKSDPVILANASDGYSRRSSVKEFIVSVGRTVAKQTLPGQRQSVQYEEYKVHSYNRSGLCALGFMDDHYPVQSAFSLLSQVLDEYQKNFDDSWRAAQADNTEPWPYLNEALTKFQHKTIDSVPAQGEMLDILIEKSSDLSADSQETTDGRSFIFRPKELGIVHGNNSRYWRMPPDNTDEPAKLLDVCWIEICGSIDIKKLNPGKKYQIGFKVSLTNGARGWSPDSVVRIIAKIGKKGKFNWRTLNLEGYERKKIFDIPDNLLIYIPRNASFSEEKLHFGLYEIWGGNWKSGLKIYHAFIKEAGKAVKSTEANTAQVHFTSAQLKEN